MKRYIKAASVKQPYKFIGYLVDDLGRYAKVMLETYAVSPEKALSNFRNQVYEDEDYAGWSLVTDPKLFSILENDRPGVNRWPNLPEGSIIIKI